MADMEKGDGVGGSLGGGRPTGGRKIGGVSLGGGVGGNGISVGPRSTVVRRGASVVIQPVLGAVGLGSEYIAAGLTKRCVFGLGKLADGEAGLGSTTLM